ncbi:MAG: HAD family phosphatase [Pseudomonadota bacterium]
MQNTSDFAAVLFDMDGTLIDTEQLNEPMIKRVLDDAGLECPDFDWPIFYGVSWANISKRLVADVPGAADIDQLPEKLADTYERLCAEETLTLIPGAEEAVKAVSANSLTGIVSSSFSHVIDDHMQRVGLASYFSCRAGADQYGRYKPEPDGYLYAADLLGVDPKHCLAFEDSEVGLQAARAAGMTVVAVTYRSNVAHRTDELADHAITDYSSFDMRSLTSFRRAT